LAKNFDVVILQKKLLGIFWLKYLRSMNKKICYDIDDALYARETFVENKKSYRPGTFFVKLKLNQTLKNVACVIAGNRILADYAKKFNRNVKIIPTPVDTDVYSNIKQPGEKNNFNIGWVGTSKNQYYLKQIIPEIHMFLSDYPDASFYFMSNKNINLIAGDNVHFQEWSAQDENEFLQKMSVGIMPLVDDDWSRGKCAFKALQYMAAGLPVIASAVGMNSDVIIHGQNGLLASGDGDWYNCLQQLYKNFTLRKEMGKNARETVVKNYSLEKWGGILINTLSKVYSANV
jgi:glycosyltransferase involved in cell wall biosynthesis